MFLIPRKCKRTSISTLLVALLFMTPLAVPGLSLAASGARAADAERAHTKLPTASLNVQVFDSVRHDTVTIVLAAQVSEATQEAASRKLTEALDSVMKQAKAEKKVDSRSGDYRIWPHTDDKGVITQWRGTAQILLESSDFGAASRLAAQLSDRMPIAGMHFSVSRALRVEREQALLAEAARAFQSRAQAIAESLGFSAYRIKNVDVGGSAYAPPPMPRLAMQAEIQAASVSADVPLEPGTESISLGMQGTIFLLGE